MTTRLQSEVAIQGTNIVGKLIGKGFSEKDGKVEEIYILQVDTKKVTLQDLVPFLGAIVVDPSKIAR